MNKYEYPGQQEFNWGMTTGFVVGVILTAIALGIVISFRNTSYQSEAINRGYAEYIMDPKTGATEWKWREPK